MQPQPAAVVVAEELWLRSRIGWSDFYQTAGPATSRG